MAYEVFGGVRAIAAGEPHTPGPRVGAVLAILLAEAPQPVGLGRLIEEVWGESPPDDPEAALHNLISRLRRVTGDDLERRPSGYALTTSNVDAARFEAAVAAARRERHPERYAAAEQLWTGDPYAGHEGLASVAVEVERLHQILRRATMERLELMIAAGWCSQAAAELEALVQPDTFDEQAVMLLMRALDGAGRKPDALRAFRSYETALAEATGLEPSAAIRELEVAILLDQSGLVRPPSRPLATLSLSISYIERAPGETVAVGRAGYGKPIVVHPGWMSKLDATAAGHDGRSPFFARLARSYELILFDRYGTGLSRGPLDDTSLRSSIDELKKVVAATTESPATVLGSSGAGPIVLQAAVEAPELFERLILIGTYASGPATFPAPVTESMLALVRASWGMGSSVLAGLIFPGASAEMLDAFAQFQQDAASTDVAVALLDEMYRADAAYVLDRVELPCLIIHYQGDKAIPVSAGQGLARRIPDARYLPLDGISHYPLPEDWDLVIGEIDRFIGIDSGLGAD